MTSLPYQPTSTDLAVRGDTNNDLDIPPGKCPPLITVMTAIQGPLEKAADTPGFRKEN